MPDLTPPPIRYTVRFPPDLPHYVDIEARIPAGGKLQVEMFLPVWTPGSYLVREYARHVESLIATDPEGNSLPVKKTRKNRWLVKSDNPLHYIKLRYLLYCKELTVRTNFRDEFQAVLHGAATFLTAIDTSAHPHEVALELSSQWKGSWSGMDGGENTFRASDYDTLVDSPIVAGSPSIQQFVIDGKPHILLNFGDSSYWDAARAIEDLERIVLQYRSMWGGLPYDRYVFFNLLTGGRGALEHRNSAVLMADRFTMRTRSLYTAWLDLVSHEFCHVWNVKRLRPVELGPFDYENEVYTRNLWIAEGFTEYYGPLTVRRAGLTTHEEFLGTNRAPRPRRGPGSLSGWIEDLQNTPGRLQQPVSTASFDAWIKFYRPDENSANSSVSYYTKGAVIAWLLDAKVRAATRDSGTLDDIMRLAFQRYGGSRGFSTDEFVDTAQEVAGIELKDWFNEVTETTSELEYSEALGWFGLRFKAPAPPDPGDAGAKAWLGLATKTDTGRLIVTEVLRGTPAYEAGISPDDEILGVDNYRVRPDQWNLMLERYRPLEVVSLLVSRRDRLVSVPVRLGEEPARRWLVEVDPEATDLQRQHLTAWLGLDELIRSQPFPRPRGGSKYPV
jgi:predicted metalloprotease with PDZ domain